MAFSSIPVQTATLTRLRTYAHGRSMDQVLNDLMDAVPPEAWAREQARRTQDEDRTEWEDVRAFLLGRP